MSGGKAVDYGVLLRQAMAAGADRETVLCWRAVRYDRLHPGEHPPPGDGFLGTGAAPCQSRGHYADRKKLIRTVSLNQHSLRKEYRT